MDRDIKKNAQAYADTHCVKIILEISQLLSTAMHSVGSLKAPYRVTHLNHPDSKYVRSCRQNYLYACNLLDELIQEYYNRYGKVHACAQHLNTFLDAAHMFPDGKLTEPPQCMPDEFKREDTVEAYRNYYRVAKRGICKWKDGNVPEWWY